MQLLAWSLHSHLMQGLALSRSPRKNGLLLYKDLQRWHWKKKLRLILVITKGYGVQATTIEMSKRFCSNDVLRILQVSPDGWSKHAWYDYEWKKVQTRVRAWLNCVLCIPFILSGSSNSYWLHTCDECVITTWRLGLRAPLVVRNSSSIYELPRAKVWRS